MDWMKLKPGDCITDTAGTIYIVTHCFECHVVARCENELVRVRETNQHNYRRATP